MTGYDLDQMADGEIWQDFDYTVTKIADGVFVHFDANSGISNTGTKNAILSVINSNSSASMATSSAGSLFGAISGSTRRFSPPAMTKEEESRLDDLENQLKAHTKLTKLNKFKSLPKHLRQEIVDECYLRDLTLELGKNGEETFSDIQELNDLRNKRSQHMWGHPMPISGAPYNMGGLSNAFGGHGKHSGILYHFSTEELAKAHAEMCLEESLNED